jgi:putative DNA primase/helicase
MTQQTVTELLKVIVKTESGAQAPGSLSDMGNARRFVERHGDKIRYVHSQGVFNVWDGTRWSADETGSIMRLAKDTVLAMYMDAPSINSDAVREKFVKWALTSQSRTKLESMIALVKTEKEISVSAEELDAGKWLLNTRNCTIDMEKWEVSDHDREQLLTRRLNFDFDMKAKCPTWERFIKRIMGDDMELVTYLQRAVGYTLTGDTSEQCMFFMYGGGKNGKSTFVEVLMTLMKEYTVKTPSDTLMQKDRGSVSNDIARLAGKRLVVASETDEGQRLSESALKDLTGGDKITARYLHHEFFEFWPSFKLWMFGNHKPLVRGTDAGIWRRIRLIPFTVTITKEEQDSHLREKLEGELPGILNWALLGLRDWQKNGLGEPHAVREATAEYRSEMDVIGTFIADITKPEGTISIPALYQFYENWCSDNGERALSQRVFGLRLKERGILQKRVTGGSRVWSGISVPFNSIAD